MTHILAKSGNGRYYIRAEGHATGSRTVCAAISGLVYALAGYLQNSCGIRTECERLTDGYAELIFSGGDDAEAVYSMCLIGLLQIEEQYPEYIEVEYSEKF